jgi:flagellar biosynthesis anti-sigma factor FlgM
MKIEVNGPAADPLIQTPSAKQVSNSGPASTQSPTEDRITLHSDSASVQSLTAQAMSLPEVRQGMVDAISQSVKSGQYQIDPTKIANAIYETEGK